VENISALRTLNTTTIPRIKLEGYYSRGDGGGGFFYWDSTSTEADNGGTIIKVGSITTGRWKRMVEEKLTLKHFGCKGDGLTDDTDRIRAAVNYAYGSTIYAPLGNYLISSSISLSSTNLLGEGANTKFFTTLTNVTLFTCNNYERVVLKDCTCETPNTGTVPVISGYFSKGSRMENIQVNGGSIGISLTGGNLLIDNLIITSTIGIKISNETPATNPLKDITIRKINFISNFLNTGEGYSGCSEVDDEDWANAWKKYYKPFKLSDKIVVKPSWENYNKEHDDIVIEIDPGMAFGTGTHETTRMCIEALEKYVTPDTTVFDIGTGSGILAITAAKLGAKEVTGVDLDPVAVDSAKTNIKSSSFTFPENVTYASSK
jgi:hypothetical protein